MRCDSASLSLNIPLDYKINVSEQGEFRKKSDTLENRILLNWSATSVVPPGRQSFAPDYSEVLSNIKIVPVRFHYGIEGSLESWGTYGSWMNSIISGLDVLPDSEKQKVDGILSGIEGEKQKINLLYQYMLESTRYIYVGIGEGGFTPYPASYVVAKKYGDCKALTIYMKALLKHAGIESYYTLVNSGSSVPRLNPDFPSNNFDHVILCVPTTEGDTMWLENTASKNPTGYFGTFTQGRLGLLVDGPKSKLVMIPVLSDEEVKVVTRIDIIMSGTDGSVSLKRVTKGPAFENYKAVSNLETFANKVRYLGNEIQLRNFEIDDLKFDQSDASKPAIQLEVAGQLKHHWKQIGQNYLLELPQTIDIPKTGSPQSRNYPLRIDYPINRIDTIHYQLPFHFDATIPSDVWLENEFGSFTMAVTKGESSLMIVKSLKISRGDWSLEKYAEFYEFLETAGKQEKSSLLIKPK